VTRGGYYAWAARHESAHAAQDRTLLAQIQQLFTRHHGRYGSPRIHHALQARGLVVSRRRVARLMREAGLRARAVLGYRAKAGVHRFFAAHPNLVRREVTRAIDRVWVGDITYLKVGTAWRYLAVVMDRCSRRVLAWTLQPRRDGTVTRDVLAAALRRRSPAPGLIFHSDRGSEYLAERLRTFLAAQGVRQSACTSGPGDNAHMESFFHSMKAEATRGKTFATDAELRTTLRDYIRYYNSTRAHSALDYRSPIDFERRVA
jgi:transposase InsO family protein